MELKSGGTVLIINGLNTGISANIIRVSWKNYNLFEVCTLKNSIWLLCSKKELAPYSETLELLLT